MSRTGSHTFGLYPKCYFFPLLNSLLRKTHEMHFSHIVPLSHEFSSHSDASSLTLSEIINRDPFYYDDVSIY